MDSRFLRDKPVKHMSYLYEHVFDGQRDNRVEGVYPLLDSCVSFKASSQI